MATKRVFVYELDGEIFVWPIARIVEKGDQVELLNTTGSDVVWNHDDEEVYGTKIKDEIKTGKKSNKQKVKGKGPTIARYSVTKASPKRRKTAKRPNVSDPVIIIET
jgi:hypothetical protein